MDLNASPWNLWLQEVCTEREEMEAKGKRFHASISWKNLASLTGQDKRALAGVAACWTLYAASDELGAAAALSAIRSLCHGAMQESAWPCARELIAYAMDWNDRERIWPLVERAFGTLRTAVPRTPQHPAECTCWFCMHPPPTEAQRQDAYQHADDCPCSLCNWPPPPPTEAKAAT